MFVHLKGGFYKTTDSSFSLLHLLYVVNNNVYHAKMYIIIWISVASVRIWINEILRQKNCCSCHFLRFPFLVQALFYIWQFRSWLFWAFLKRPNILRNAKKTSRAESLKQQRVAKKSHHFKRIHPRRPINSNFYAPTSKPMKRVKHGVIKAVIIAAFSIFGILIKW